jgi:translation initiation factor 3 subunit E
MTEGMEQWDLTAKVSPYLDRHMMFPLLEYMDGLISAGTVSYSSKDVAAARLALLRPTHMVDYAIDIYKNLEGADAAVPKEMEDQKTDVYKRLEELEKGCKALHELCGKGAEKVRQC